MRLCDISYVSKTPKNSQVKIQNWKLTLYNVIFILSYRSGLFLLITLTRSLKYEIFFHWKPRSLSALNYIFGNFEKWKWLTCRLLSSHAYDLMCYECPNATFALVVLFAVFLARRGVIFWSISLKLEKVITEHMVSNCSSESKLFFLCLCSVGNLARSR